MPFDFRKEYSSLSQEDVTKLKKYFYDKKRQEGSGEQDILSLLLPSFIGILLCLICLTGMTWAWFTSAITTTSTISGASFNIEVEIKETDTSGAIEGTNGSYALEANKDYTVTIKKAASSTASGYGLITIGTACYYTDKIDTSEYKFQIETGATDVTATFTPAWGTPDSSAGEKIISGGSVMLGNTIGQFAVTTPDDKTPEGQKDVKKDEAATPPADTSGASKAEDSDVSLSTQNM